MNEITLTRMKQMKLYGMHNAFKTAIGAVIDVVKKENFGIGTVRNSLNHSFSIL